MNTKNELQNIIVTDAVLSLETSSLDVFTNKALIETIISEIERKVGELPQGSLEDKKGRDQISSNAYTVARTKTFIDSHGKTAVDKLKKIPIEIDKGRKRFRDRLDEIKNEIRAPLDAWNKKEEILKAQINNAFEKLNGLLSHFQENDSSGFKRRLEDLEAISDLSLYGGREEEAKVKIEETRLKLQDSFDQRVKLEKEQAEKKVLMDEKLLLEEREREREQLERERKTKEHAIEMARIKEIERNKAEKERIEQERIAEKEKIEQERIAEKEKHEREIQAEKNRRIEAEHEAKELHEQKIRQQEQDERLRLQKEEREREIKAKRASMLLSTSKETGVSIEIVTMVILSYEKHLKIGV